MFPLAKLGSLLEFFQAGDMLLVLTLSSSSSSEPAFFFVNREDDMTVSCGYCVSQSLSSFFRLVVVERSVRCAGPLEEQIF